MEVFTASLRSRREVCGTHDQMSGLSHSRIESPEKNRSERGITLARCHGRSSLRLALDVLSEVVQNRLPTLPLLLGRQL